MRICFLNFNPISLTSRASINTTKIIHILLIAYGFLIPISNSASSKILVGITIIGLFSEEFLQRLVSTLRQRLILSFLFLYTLNAVWMIGSTNLDMPIFRLNDYKYIFGIIILGMFLKQKTLFPIITAFLSGMFVSELCSYAMAVNITIPFLHFTQGMGNVPFMETYSDYSTILSIALAIILYQFITHTGSLTLFQKGVYTFFFVSASFNIAILAGRSGYIMYALSILTVLIFIYRKKMLKALIIATLLIVGGYTFAYNVSPLFQTRVNTFINDIQLLQKNDFSTGVGARAGFYYYSIDLIKANPFFGVGAGDHIEEFKKIIVQKDSNPSNIHELFFNVRNGVNASLHSEILDDITQFGLVGLMVFLSIFYHLMHPGHNDPFRTFLATLTIVVFFASSFAGNLFNSDFIGRFFLFFSALSLITYEERKKQEASQSA